MKSNRCVRCKMCNFSTTSTQQYGRTLGSEVTNFPGSGAYIPLGSLPSRQFRYLKRRIASLAQPGNPASRRRYSQPRPPAQALPPGPIQGQARRYHVLFLPGLPTSTWVLGLSTTTPNLSVCLRGSSDSVSQFISATEIQLTQPSQLYYIYVPLLSLIMVLFLCR